MPTARTSAKASTTRAKARPAAKSKDTTPDELATRFAQVVRVDDTSGKGKAKERGAAPGDTKAEAMASVNAVSHGLSALLPSANGAAAPKPTRSSPTVEDLAAMGRRSLQVLRGIIPGDFDVERAASSIVGKLISLERYKDAVTYLSDMRPALASLYTAAETKDMDHASRTLSILYLPLPLSSEHPTDTLKITLLSNYLAHALATLSHILFSPEALEKVSTVHGSATITEAAVIDDVLEEMLQELFTSDTILQWQPYLSAVLPSKQVDAFLTRTYTTVIKSSAVKSSTHPRAVFALRHYTLLCLLRTQPGSIAPDMFWDQANKFCSSLFQRTMSSNSSNGKQKNEKSVLRTFSRVVEYAEGRSDHAEFLSGRGFVHFCEYWLDFAKRAGRMGELGNITRLMRSADANGPSPMSYTPGAAQPRLPNKPNNSEGAASRGTQSGDRDGLRAAAVFVQAISLLEDWTAHGVINERGESRPSQTISDVIEALAECSNLIAMPEDLESDNASDKDSRRAGSKVRRAMEKLRRAAMKVIDGSSKVSRSQLQATIQMHQVQTMLLKMVDVYADAAKQRPIVDFLSPALDTLFTLSRLALVAHKPETYDTSYDLLMRTLSLPGIAMSPTSEDGKGKSKVNAEVIHPVAHANYIRCISGAFHNLSAALYQAGKYGVAARFLEKGCTLGVQALASYRLASVSQSEQSPEGETGEKQQVWTQLVEQVHRRWELLGVCQMKTGDRKAAYNAFVEAIKAYLYDNTTFVDVTGNSGIKSIFESTTHQQLANLVDRATYLAANELFMAAAEVPLSHALNAEFPMSTSGAVLGAVLEQQVDGLEGSKWKPATREITKAILSEALRVYVAEETPVRRARVLVKCLEYAYHESPDTLNVEGYLGRHATDVLAEVQKLVVQEELYSDARLAHFRPQYLASAHLWFALLSHRGAHAASSSTVVENSEEACRVMKASLGVRDNITSPKKALSPKASRTARTKASKAAPPRAAPTTKAGTLRSKKTPATPAPRKALRAISTNTEHATPLRPTTDIKRPADCLDDCSQLLGLFDMVAKLLGLMGHVIPKLNVLQSVKKICEKQPVEVSDAHVRASVELAHEYVKLGKLRKANTMYQHALITVKSGGVTDEVQVLALLRCAESLAMIDDVLAGSSRYCEAMALSQSIVSDIQGLSTAQRVRLRVDRLERTAMGASTYAMIQHHRDDPTAALTALLQSLRLWNRAAESLDRLNPAAQTAKAEAESDDPFAIKETKAESTMLVNTPTAAEQSAPKRVFQRTTTMDGREWRIAEGLLGTLFALTRAYVARGSAREAEYFVQQAQDLAESLNLPAMLSRAYARRGEIHLHLGKLDTAHSFLIDALALMHELPGVDAADIRRLCGVYNELAAEHKNAQQLFTEASSMLTELEKAFSTVDGHPASPRKLKGTAVEVQADGEAFVPCLLAALLRGHIWSLRDDPGDEYNALLQRYASLPTSVDTQAEQQALTARLTLHDAFGRFHADMFLSSLTESTIALPTGMKSDKPLTLSPATQEVVAILGNAEKLFWDDLTVLSKRGNVPHVRDATISLAMISALQASLGRAGVEGPRLATSLLDVASALTLRREFLEVVQLKFLDVRTADDLQWPLMTPNGTTLPTPVADKFAKRARLNSLRFDDDNDSVADNDDDSVALRRYWDGVRARYEASTLDAASLATSHHANSLPAHWAVVSLSVSADRSSLFVARQRAGREPLVFCLPLKGRREGEDDEQLGFADAVDELGEIIRLSDEATRGAVNVDKDCKRARAKWWAERSALDKRIKELLENIEFCWLGAFKTILSRSTDTPPEALAALRARIEKAFKRGLSTRDRKHRAGIRLDDALVECLAALSPKCKDEELEDVVYFVLDLYQFHGVPVVLSEVDVDQLAVDLRTALEEHALVADTRDSAGQETQDEHLFLILDKNVQGIPWESLPILRGRSVSRIPDLSFLVDRLELARGTRDAGATACGADVDRAAVDPRSAYYVLNPSGDLKATEGRFAPWLADMKKKVGWSGIVGRAPSEQELLHALEHKELVVYFGHGGGEQYVRSHKIRHLSKCAATMLWGCSSGALREMGEFDRTGTPYNYMLAGCPTLVANLWDVTDKDIDKFAQAVFDDLRLTPEGVRARKDKGGTGDMSVVTAVAKARESCKLKYLTGAAPVVYGIPFYL